MKEVNDKFLSMMLDITTKNGRAILGISLQFISNGEKIIRSVAMTELEERHVAEYLKLKVEECLEKYEIEKIQLVAIATDNGTNMVSMVEKLNEDDSDVDVSENSDVEDDCSDDGETPNNVNSTENNVVVLQENETDAEVDRIFQQILDEEAQSEDETYANIYIRSVYRTNWLLN